jgi:hypothetical protein
MEVAMKRIAVVLAVFLVLFFVAGVGFSLNLSVGVLGGPVIADYRGDDSGGADARLGFSAGAYFRFPISKMFAFEPEALLTLRGADLGGGFKQNLWYIDIPAVLRIYPPKVPLGLNAQVGGYLGINLSDDVKNGTTFEGTIETLDFGLIFGAGIEIKKFIVDGRYSLGLADLPESGGDINNHFLSILVGYKFK